MADNIEGIRSLPLKCGRTATPVAPPSKAKDSPLTTENIEMAVQAMDIRYRTTFGQWIRSPGNTSCTGERLRRVILARKPPVPDVARVLKWVTESWEAGVRQQLVRAVTFGWEADKRRLLEFWMVRLERGFEVESGKRKKRKREELVRSGNERSARVRSLSQRVPDVESVTRQDEQEKEDGDRGESGDDIKEVRDEEEEEGGREGKRSRIEENPSSSDQFGMDGGSSGFAL
ncbi:uncharacterized protein VTP21DRAFT_10184 [Calcarisporiella thermophila]|uniref:uncharacterized protein n=1 Tax=Calcarisporiella thermophila TaxID=911321 RepID=UPI00374288C6